MALNNEAYIVQTATAGDIIVPVKESVPYLNVTFLGWKHYNYHEVMSQNIANLADDIATIKDGGAAEATFNLNELLAQTQTEIDNKISLISDTTTVLVETLTEEALYNLDNRVVLLETTVNGTTLLPGLLSQIQSIVSTIGNDSTGIIHDINSLEIAIGNVSSGLIKKVNQNESDIISLSLSLGDTSSGLTKKVNDLSSTVGSSTAGIIKDLNNVKNVVGDINSGLVKEIDNINSTLYTDVSGLVDIIGDANSGHVKAIADIQTALSTMSSDINLEKLQTVVGDENSGLVYSNALLTEELSSLQTTIGNSSSGIIHDVETLKLLDLTSLTQTVFGTDSSTGLVNIVGSSTKGLVKQVNDLTTNTNSQFTAFSTHLSQNDLDITSNTNSITTINAQLPTLSTSLTNLNSTVVNIQSLINTPVTGIIPRLDNMPTTIRDSLLTYTSGGTSKVFTPTELYNIFTTTKAIEDNNIVNQFKTYFYDTVTSSYITTNKIGKSAVLEWVNDLTASGYTTLTNNLINTLLNSYPKLNQIDTNKNNISILNGGVAVLGSVDNKINSLYTELYNTTPGSLGSITTIEGNLNTPGSIDYKIKVNNDTLLSSTGQVGINTNDIAALKTKNNDNDIIVNNLVEEIQVEMVRYSTILPFLQQMFKLVNKLDNVTDSEIDTIFDSLQNKIAQISGTIQNIDYIIKWNSINKTFNITITLDKDFKFIPYDPLDNIVYLIINDKLGNQEWLTLTIDQLASGQVINLQVPNILYDTNNTPITITDPFVSAIQLKFKIANSFGVEQLMTINVT